MKPVVNVRRFGELATFRNGVNFSASSRGKGDLAVIGVGDFQKNERLSYFDELERIARPKGLDDDALLRDGDLVFVRSNGNKELIGRCMVLERVNGPVTHSGFTIRARLTTSDIQPEWIAQYFATGLARKAIMRRGGGTNISNLSQQILQDLPVPVPNPQYQNSVLRAAEQLSASLRLMTALLDAKRTFKRGLSQRLLSGQKRFPKFQSCRWKATALGDVVTCNLRKVPKPSGTFLSAGVRSHGKGVFLKEEFHSDQIALDELFEIKQGDLVVNITFGWEGAVAIVPPEADGALVSHRFPTYVVDQRKVLIEYLRHVIRARRFVFEVAVASPGGAGRNRVLNRSAFLQIPILLPGIEEQQEIASILNSCDKEIDLLERLRGQVGMHKRAFLSRLLSGELFIPTA